MGSTDTNVVSSRGAWGRGILRGRRREVGEAAVWGTPPIGLVAVILSEVSAGPEAEIAAEGADGRYMRC